MNRDAVAECPDAGAMAALVDGRVADTIRDGMLAHIASCARCAGEFQRLSGGWSLAHLADPAFKQAGVDTLALRQRLAASPPPATTGGGDEAATAAMPRAAPRIPGIIDLEPIGRGGMGVVYRGRDTRLDRIVAVKVLSAWTPLSHAARQRAEREALMLGRLDHPNVVAIHAAGEVEGTPYLVMEWVAGPSLQKLLADGRLEPREAARIAHDLARALQRVHALGMIHRDVKPDNVLMAPRSGGPAVPKLADFGLARPDESTHQLTLAEDVLGTPAYMAPEQTGLDLSLGEVGPAADIHALGGVLFAMLTGHAPYEAATALASMQRSLRGEVTAAALAGHAPVDLRTIMWKCLEPMPGRRYRSAGELADDLERFLDGRPVSARLIPLPLRLAKWTRRRPMTAATAGLAVMLAGLAVGGTVYHVVKLERANVALSRSRDEARDSLAVAQRSMQRLTSESIRRMLFRGTGLDEGDRAYLQQVRDEFATWPLGTDPRGALTFRADGLRQVAMLFAKVGQFDDMLACLGREREALDELERVSPGDIQVVRRRLDLMYQERHALGRLGRTHEVVASARQSLAILESPPDALVIAPTEVADTRIQLGTYLIRIGEVDEAAGQVRDGIAGLRELRQASPDDRGTSRQFIMALFNAAIAANNAGWPNLHRQWLEELVVVGEDSLKRAPEDREVFARGVALGLAGLTTLAEREGRLPEALLFAERWRAFGHAQVPGGDDVTPLHREAANADITTIDLLRKAGDDVAARMLLDTAAPFVKRLYAAEPAVFDTAILQAHMLRQCGQLLVDPSDPSSAMPWLTQEISVLEPWVNFTPQAGFVKARLDEARGLLAALTERVATSVPQEMPD